VRDRSARACQRAGRDPASVTLVCVTKQVSVDRIREALALGITDVGENRVQEAQQKWAKLGPLPGIRRHLIGHLQRNKAKDAVALFDVIHSVDSIRLADELERQAAQRNNLQPIEVFLQVNVSGETTKFGCAPDDVPALAHTAAQLPHLRLAGLMTMAPFSENPEDARPHFRRLRELRDQLQTSLMTQSPNHLITQSLKLSMGMSGDFEVAIEEGADVIRVGTAIFGAHA